MAMAESDGSTVPRVEYAAVTSAEVNPHRGLLIKYRLVCVYTSPYSKYSKLQGRPPSVDDSIVVNITIFPPDHFNVEDDRASPKNPALSTNGLYCHGDPRNWAVLFPSSDRTVDEHTNFEIMVSEQEIVAENATDNSIRTIAWEALRILDGDSNYIVKDSNSDAVIDDNGYKMLLVKFLVGPPDQTEEPFIFHLERIVAGQETVLTEREKERLRLYLAGGYDRDDEEVGQGGEGKEGKGIGPDGTEDENKEVVQSGEGKEEEDKDPDETEDENEQGE